MSKYFSLTLFGLLTMFFGNHPNALPVLSRVWILDKELFQQAMIEVYKKDPAISSNLLNLVQELRASSPLFHISFMVFDIILLSQHYRF